MLARLRAAAGGPACRAGRAAPPWRAAARRDASGPGASGRAGWTWTMSMTTSTLTPMSTAARRPPSGTSRRRALSASAQAAASPATPPSREERAAAAQSQAVRSYEVRITTGNRRGASTTAAVYVRLIGKYANTQRIEVPGEFTRDTTVVAVIKTPHPLGRIRIVEVGHDNVGDLGVGWYLESIELIELKDSASTHRPQEYHHHQQHRAAHGTMPAHQIPNLQEGDVVRTLMFPVRRWLGKSDIGVGNYPTSVQLRVGIADSMTDPTSFMLPGAQLIKGTKAEPFFIKCGAAAFPHPEKVRDGERGVVRPDIGHAGEDAYSIATVRTPDRNALEKLGKLRAGTLVKSKLPTTVTISVCDGVYQWRDKGIDAGEWSRYLSRMLLYQGQHHVRDPDAQDSIQSERWTQSYKDLGLLPPLVPLAHPSAMLKAAEERIRETELLGSSTACVASLHGLDNMMFVACLGDSGVLVYRKSMGVIFRTPEQEHAFGYPFQLGHHDVSDHASDALVSHCRITSGDVVIVASDGLFDNLFESQISKILDKHMDTRNAQLCATELASEAYANSVSERMETPYSQAAGEEFNLVWCGGKKDDISVVVAFIVDK